MPVNTSAGRYVWWATDANLPAPTTSGKTFFRGIRGACTARWVKNAQDVYVDTGDTSNRVDSIEQNPHSEVTITSPFFPSQLSGFMANCMLATGAGAAYGPLLPPVSMTFGFGNGLDEQQWAGCQLVGNPTLTVDGAWCTWSWTFQGSEKPVSATVIAPSSLVIPAWERPLRKSNLKLATLIASASPLSEKKLRGLTLTLMNNNTPLYDSRGDGLDGISDFALDYLGFGFSFNRAFTTTLERDAFLAECGQDGPANFTFVTTCGTGTHTHEFAARRARYTSESIEAQKNDLMREPLVGESLRPLTSDAATLYSELMYKYTVA